MAIDNGNATFEFRGFMYSKGAEERFDYGQIAPWINRDDEGTLRAVAGPDLVLLRTAAPFHGEGLRTRGVFEVAAGEIVPFVLTHGPSHKPAPEPINIFMVWDPNEGHYQGAREAALGQRALVAGSTAAKATSDAK